MYKSYFLLWVRIRNPLLYHKINPPAPLFHFLFKSSIFSPTDQLLDFNLSIPKKRINILPKALLEEYSLPAYPIHLKLKD